MDPIKKRKLEQNGVVKPEPGSFISLMLTRDDARKIVDILTQDQLLGIVQNALLRHPDVLDVVRSFANRDPTHRKLFVRGLGWETTTEKLHSLFSSYGELEEAVVISDKATGKSKGYGFVTFKHIDGSIMALKEPSKQIDGRMTVTQLASVGVPVGSVSSASVKGVGDSVGGVGGGASVIGVTNYNTVDVLMRKIYVGNVPHNMVAERLLGHFSMYGEVEEGPLGFDKKTGKSRGYALFVYRTPQAAQASLVDPIKNIDGYQLNCKMAADGKKGNAPTPMGPVAVHGGNQGIGDGICATMPSGPYAGVGNVVHGIGGGIGAKMPGGPYAGLGNIIISGGLGAGVGRGLGGPGLPITGSQAAGSNLGVSVGFSSTVVGTYAGGSHFGGPVGTGYGGYGVGLSATGNGLGSGAGSGGAGSGMGSSVYSLPHTSAGMGSGDYPRSVHYSLSSSGFLGQHSQPTGASSAPRVPPGSVHRGMPPY